VLPGEPPVPWSDRTSRGACGRGKLLAMGAEQLYASSGKDCTYESCDRPAWADCPEGRCLFHSPHNGRTEETARLIWKTARSMAAEESASETDFRNWRFPQDPDFNRADRWRGGQPKGAFVGAVFASTADFSNATFSGATSFDSATFSRGGVLFVDATFTGSARFDGTMFNGPAWFVDATFIRDVGFRAAMFNGNAMFDGATFTRDAEFRGTLFNHGACFSGATFNGSAWFDATVFNEDAVFYPVHWSPGATLKFDIPSRQRRSSRDRAKRSNCLAIRMLRWPAAWWSSSVIGGPYPFRLRREGETAYRSAKQAAQGAGDYAAAGRYHYAEQWAIEDRCRDRSGLRPWRGAFWHWIGRLLFARTVFGYGERPWHPLLVGLAVIIACGALYAAFDAVGRGVDGESV